MTLVQGSPGHRSSPPVPVAAEPIPGESIAATWCRDIAATVAAALDTTFYGAAYQLTLHDNRPTPRHLRVAFQTAGHHVHVHVRWPDPSQAPRFDLHVDGRAVTLDDITHPSAPVLARTIWQAVLDAPE
jgi:hypothetical protein